ncbi:exopolysaccharide biosynthesis protein [Devosia sp. SL43]|uniref:exopolysaccharide biosynthesis protein n=1 Tax=Devosia sp. SL43 TaxID=2806348 RepID=UPI001F3150A3|nr:exopolysaccharide biosynthesis protein [Devosia sp. SL43]UJW86262.1 exopolysaccharide biosynthesis protein [Devosia sp. SL43]
MAEDEPTIDIHEVPPSEGADRLSAILTAIAKGQDRERISIADLLHALEHRAIGALMFIFAVPNAIPVPPGVSAVLGAPLIFLSFQLMIGRRPWLPKLITDRSLSRVDFEKVVDLTAPWLAKAERLMRPRFEFLAKPPAEYLIGAICLLLSIILFLPIPLGNMLPAFTICVLALGVLERDGLWIGIGIACAVGAVVIVWGVMLALLWSALFVLGSVFGITLAFG